MNREDEVMGFALAIVCSVVMMAFLSTCHVETKTSSYEDLMLKCTQNEMGYDYCDRLVKREMKGGI